ncbi:MAG: hypothetical protein KJ058_00895 [Thermoanaerobaculia bacterium]|nr:hypothetical protein [Thermoanaerobaculia bacterium]
MSTLAARGVASTFTLKVCPRCEEGVLTSRTVPHEIEVGGSPVRLPAVQVEVCARCGFQELSGRETRLFELLFAPRAGGIAELVATLHAAGMRGLFLRDSVAESALAFGSAGYVEALAGELRELYLDNEAGHVLSGLDRVEGTVPVDLAGTPCSVKLPKLGEGENGVVFDFAERDDAVLKLAKPRPYSRDHVRQECALTELFAGEGVPVPAVLAADPEGRFVVKERLAGVSLAVLYDELGPPGSPRHERARAAVERFAAGLLELFARRPETKTSISPNNVFVLERNGECRCLLVDTGPAPTHDYSRFDFRTYWEETVPEKIARYRAVGFI